MPGNGKIEAPQMTIQTLGIGRTAYPDLSYAPASPRALDKLSVCEISKKLVAFHPPGTFLPDLLTKASQKMGPLASSETVKKVVSFNPDNFWAIARRSRLDWNAPQAEGFVALLMLNARGEQALFDGTLNGLDPTSPSSPPRTKSRPPFMSGVSMPQA